MKSLIQMNSINRLARVFLYVGVVWAIVFNLVFLPRLDVDTYHDGFIYPMALQSSRGFVPNVDFFSVYGPIGPTMSGLWVKFFGESVLALRFYGTFLILSIALLMYLIIRKVVNMTVSLILTLVWLLGNPLIVHPSLPWADLHTTLILVLGIQIITNTKLIQVKLQKASFFLGLFFGLAIFAKVNFGLVVATATLLLAIQFGIGVSSRFVGGVFSSSLLILAILAVKGALVPYFEQTIYFAWIQHDEGKELRGIVNIKSILFGCVLLLVAYFSAKFQNWLSRFGNSVSKFVILTASCTTWIIIALQFRDINEPFRALSLKPAEDFANVLKNAPYLPLFASIFVLPVLYFINFKKTASYVNSKEKQSELFVGLLCTSYIVLLYPNPEPGHLWYVFPVMMIGITQFLSLQERRSSIESITKYVVAPTICALVTINFQYLNIERTNHTEVPLVGMIGRPEAVSRIDKTLSALNTNVSSTTVKFDCPRGVYSVFSNSYFASDYQFVDVIPSFYKSKIKAPLTFECDLDFKETEKVYQDFEVVFETKGELAGLRNILYRTP